MLAQPLPPRDPHDQRRPTLENQFVATRWGEVVAAASDLDALLRRMRASGIDDRSVVIEFVGRPVRARIF